MALVLEPREVARANITHVDKLAAFNGKARECLFYYRNVDGTPDGCRCAIGVADRGSALAKLPKNFKGTSANELFVEDIIRCTFEELPVLEFIQNVHDEIVWSGGGTGIITGETLRQSSTVRKFI